MLEKYSKTCLEIVTEENYHDYVKKPWNYWDFQNSINVLATVLSVSAPANALNFTTFTNRGLWEAEVGSFSEETFNSYTVDTSFNDTNVDVGDFTLNGTTGFGGVQIIDVPPLTTSFFNIDCNPWKVSKCNSEMKKLTPNFLKLKTPWKKIDT